jgi:hypothetical protein
LLPAQALELEDQPHPHDIPRLGETVEYGSLLLRLVELSGWQVDVRPAIGGVIVYARRPGRVIQRAGETVADVALPMFEEAMRARETS